MTIKDRVFTLKQMFTSVLKGQCHVHEETLVQFEVDIIRQWSCRLEADLEEHVMALDPFK